MESKEIFYKLNKDLKIVQKNYPVENIFGIFTKDPDSTDLKSEAVIIPPFDFVCSSTIPIDKNLNDIHIFDARNILRATELGHPEVIGSLYHEYKIVNPKYEHLFQKILVANRDIIKKGVQEGKPAVELQLALNKLCRDCWSSNSKTINFIKQITDAEKLALDGIIKAVGDEGTFSQAKVASAVGISRLTMSNLVMKLKFNDIAIVRYLGNKGTYIKFIDDIVINIRGIILER